MGHFFNWGSVYILLLREESWLDFIFTLHCRLRVKLKPTVVWEQGFCRGVGEAVMVSASRYQSLRN